MTTELIGALSAPELKELLALVSGANASDVVERDLLRRRGEIELELSSMTAARDEAVANKKAAEDRVRQRLETGWHPTRLKASLLVLGFGALGALASVPIGWAVGTRLLESWQSPFSSGWIAAAVWSLLYASVAMTIFEADFYLRRLPARRLLADREEKTTDLRMAVDETQSARRKQLILLVRDHITEILNSSRGPQFGSSLRVKAGATSGKSERITVGVGLSEITNDDNRVATDVQQRLVHLLTSLPGASIGISGPRGVGKSSLLTALCGANPTISGRAAIAINTSAPVEYDGREFLLHLFSSLCRQVLRTEGLDDAVDEDRGALLEAGRWRRASVMEELKPLAGLSFFVGTALVGIAVMLAMLQSPVASDRTALSPAASEIGVTTPLTSPAQGETTRSLKPSTAGPKSVAQTRTRTTPAATRTPAPATEDASSLPSDIFKTLISMPLFSLGVVLLVFGFMGIVVPFFYRNILRPADPKTRYYHSAERGSILNRARQELRNIGFQRSYTSGWSGSLKVPVGLDMTSSAGLTLAQRTESMPELVERFRSFVRDVARVYDNVVLIGIDELDKLKSAQQAEAFLNGVKSVFGIPRCFYLISVSEHALAAFERRGIGFRDAFDSALDDIVQVDFLDLNQSRVMLNRRILRLPDPFLQLCYMLSGGLPRDLIRHARSLLDCAGGTSNGVLSLKKAVEQMAERDLAARLRATSITIRTVKEIAETNELLVMISSLAWASTIKTATAALAPFRAHLDGLTNLRDSEEGRVLLRLSEELAIYYETIILLRRITAFLSTRKGWERATTLGLAEQVAGVRQALEVGVPLAEVRLAELRRAVDDAASAIDRTVNPHLYRVKL